MGITYRSIGGISTVSPHRGFFENCTVPVYSVHLIPVNKQPLSSKVPHIMIHSMQTIMLVRAGCIAGGLRGFKVAQDKYVLLSTY